MRSRVLIGGLAAFGVALAGSSPAWADDPAEAGITRVSVTADGVQGNSASINPAISADGRFAAFRSNSVNLSPGNFTSGGVFVKELATGALDRIGTGFLPTLSADGRYVAYLSTSTNLVPGDTNGRADVFVVDRQDGTTRRVSVASDGAQADGASVDAAIAAGGRYVVFSSSATNLAPGATGAYNKVFVHDLETATTTEVSVTPDGRSGSAESYFASISADGQRVAFASKARELVPGGVARNVNSAYVRDLATGTTRRLYSGAVRGFVSLSADGRYVGFMDSRPGIVPEDTNGFADVFRWDLTTDEVVQVNVSTEGVRADKESGTVPQGVPMSDDGRYVLFESPATNLTPGDTNGRRDVFLRDTVEGTTIRISPDAASENASRGNYVGSISGDGAAAVWMSELPTAPEDTNLVSDVYLWNRG